MANIKVAYAAAVALTFGVNSLASSSTLVAGYETNEVDNTANLYSDFIVRGHIKEGTTPTVSTNIEIWVIPVIDADAYPDVFASAAGAKTVTSRNILRSVGKLGAVITVDATTGNVYPFHFALSQVPGIGQSMPRKFVLFVTQATAVALDATGANHACDVVGVSYTVV